MRKRDDFYMDEGFRDRDKALIHFITTGSPRKIDAYFRRYGIQRARDGRIHYGALYRMAQQCRDIPYSIRYTAMELGMALGFPAEAFRVKDSVWRSRSEERRRTDGP